MKLCTDRLKKVSGAHKPPCIQRFPLQWQTGGQSSCTYFLMGKLRHKVAKSRAKTWLGHLVTCDVTPSLLLNCTGSLGSCKMLVWVTGLLLGLRTQILWGLFNPPLVGPAVLRDQHASWRDGWVLLA